MNKFLQELEKDHAEVKTLLGKLEDTSQGAEKTREDLFLKLRKELVPHMKAEEKVFYPALLEEKEARANALESLEEHHVTELVLNELSDMAKTEERWTAKMSVFRELVEHHIEEEESEIFDDAEEMLKEEQLEKIHQEFQKEKERVKKSL